MSQKKTQKPEDETIVKVLNRIFDFLDSTNLDTVQAFSLMFEEMGIENDKLRDAFVKALWKMT